MEDEDQNIHFKNLSVHRAASEEEALNLVGQCPPAASPRLSIHVALCAVDSHHKGCSPGLCWQLPEEASRCCCADCAQDAAAAVWPPQPQ